MLRKGAVLPSLGRRWPLRGGHFDCAIAGSACSLSTATKPAPPTPDFTTTVDVANIRLNRPTRRKRKIEGSWEGLPGLASRTQGSLIDSTLEAMDSDEDFKLTVRSLRWPQPHALLTTELFALRFSYLCRTRRQAACARSGQSG